jgi:hypothetical protein
VDTTMLATAFLQWSAQESGYGQDPSMAAGNNDFGAQNPTNAAGNWSGTTVPCVRDGNPIPVNSKNACFAPSLSWGSELTAVLDTTSSKTGGTYFSAIENQIMFGLAGNGAAGLIQSIGNNGWNGGTTYGSGIASGIKINGVIDCMKQNKLLP